MYISFMRHTAADTQSYRLGCGKQHKITQVLRLKYDIYCDDRHLMKHLF